MKIAILNYNIGNLASVRNALEFCAKTSKHTEICIESNPSALRHYDKIILPGVGAFGDSIKHLQANGMDRAIHEFVKSGKYLLGICLGMQLLLHKSYEFGSHRGLGLIQGEVVKFKNLDFLKIPQIGWNTCLLTDEGRKHPLFKDYPQKFYLYFVHSFHATDIALQDTLAFSKYGYSFPSIIARENVLGIQPHPEKSHNLGLKLLENFIAL